MTWRTEKTDEGQDYVWDGVEQGIGVSPTKGTAAIQNANISTEIGEVMASYGRTNEAQTAISGGTLTASVGDGATLLDAPAALKAGTWIKVTASTITSVTATTGATTASIDYLIVGGGGGGGGTLNEGAAGGGGAGEMVTGTTTIGVTSHVVTIGTGGGGGSVLSSGTDGNSTVLGSIDTAVGGGGGGVGVANLSPITTMNGRAGGSGGGGGAGGVGYQGTGGTATAGNNGGAGFENATATNRAGGGGGGAGGAGTNGASTAGGAGGAGTSSSISGTATVYAAGGGGGAVGTPGAGGSTGVGGAGGEESNGSAGAVNTGSGGGGAASSTSTDYSGGDGADGIVIISYTTGTMVATGGTITYTATKTIHTFYSSDTFTVVAVNPGGYYYVSYENASGKVKLSSLFDPTAANVLTHGTSGTATFDTVATPGSAVAKATERYTTATAAEYRYYILDTNGRVWYYDTAVYDSSLAASGVATTWMLPDPYSYAALNMTGMAVLNGYLMTVSNARIYGKPVTNLGMAFRVLENAFLNEPFPTHKNFAYVGNQGKMYYCDGNYIGELFPTTSLETSVANIQSHCTYTASSSTTYRITVSSIIGGSLPYSPDGTRIPIVFYVNQYGTLPTAVTQNTVYYLGAEISSGTFRVYTALTGGSGVDVYTGAAGTQYFNTFYPFGLDAGINGTDTLVQYSSQRVNLPQFETAQCMVEVDNTVLIGCNGSVVYPWNQVDATPSGFITLPESDVKAMVNVNNMGYVFAGNKGNVYITNNSVASLVLKVPDYCAGVPGTPLTYIEPYFTWGDAMYVRGRVYFSILDQTATKAGNCGGVWSFIPTQNFYVGQDVGLSLRLENQNTYGSYNGYATILIPNEEQLAVSPQYWAAWQSSYSTGTSTFGIDNTSTVPVTQYVLETDILATGTFLSKDTFTQLEYKLTTPMTSGDAVQLYYRLNATDAWTTCGTVREETDNRLSGYFDQPFQKTQWVQFRAVVATGGTTSSSFVRLKQIRLR